MSGLTINVSWEYFLGVMGALIAIAYYTNGRFAALETSVEWLKETARELLIRFDNRDQKVLRIGSPIALTRWGRRLLHASGLESYVDQHAQAWLAQVGRDILDNPYHLQSWAFRLLANVSFDDEFEAGLGAFAFSNGLSIDLLRRIGAVHLRDITSVNHQSDRRRSPSGTPKSGAMTCDDAAAEAI
jgi:hypothetical protein